MVRLDFSPRQLSRHAGLKLKNANGSKKSSGKRWPQLWRSLQDLSRVPVNIYQLCFSMVFQSDFIPELILNDTCILYIRYLYILVGVAPLVWFHWSPAVCIPPFALGEGPLRSLAGAWAGIGASACEGGCWGSAPGTGKVADCWTILARFVYDFFGWRSFGYRELKLKTERFFDDQNE